MNFWTAAALSYLASCLMFAILWPLMLRRSRGMNRADAREYERKKFEEEAAEWKKQNEIRSSTSE